MDYSPIRNNNSNDDAPWYREYLIMSPALIIILLIVTIFIKLLCFRRWLTKEVRLLESIEVPPPPARKNKTTQTGLDSVVVVYDGPSTSKIGEEEVVIPVESPTAKGAMYYEPMCTPAMVGSFAI